MEINEARYQIKSILDLHNPIIETAWNIIETRLDQNQETQNDVTLRQMEYNLLQEESINEMQKSVNYYLRQGWKLYGSLIELNNTIDKGYIIQAMIREKEVKVNKLLSTRLTK